MAFRIRNDVRTELTQAINASQTEIRIAKAIAPFRDPPPIDGGTLHMTIVDDLAEVSQIEIIEVTNVGEDGAEWVLTAVRGVEGSSAYAFAQAAPVFLAITAAAFDSKLDVEDYQDTPPGGATGQVQINDAGSFGGIPVEWDGTAFRLDMDGDLALARGDYGIGPPDPPLFADANSAADATQAFRLDDAASNSPATKGEAVVGFNLRRISGRNLQIAGFADGTDNFLALRQQNGTGTWSPWAELWHNGNLPLEVSGDDIGVGVSPSQRFDVDGKIRMRTETEGSDGDDIVVTKGFLGGAIAAGAWTKGPSSIYSSNFSLNLSTHAPGTLFLQHSSSSLTVTLPTPAAGDVGKTYYFAVPTGWTNGVLNFSGSGIAGPTMIRQATGLASATVIDVGGGGYGWATSLGRGPYYSVAPSLAELVAGQLSLANLTVGNTTQGAVWYNGTTRAAGKFYGGTTNPISTTRLNYDGNFHAREFFTQGLGTFQAGILAGPGVTAGENELGCTDFIGQVAFGAEQTFSTTGDINSFALGAFVNVLRYTGSGATLRGIQGGRPGRILVIVNGSTSNILNLANENTNATTVERISCAQGQVPLPGPEEAQGASGAVLMYIGGLNRWVVLSFVN